MKRNEEPERRIAIPELPPADHAIVGVPTSITAFVGAATTGPVNEPVAIRADTEYERTFGSLALNSPMSFAVHDFFENGGAEAVIVRLAPVGGGAGDDSPLATADYLGSQESKTGIYALLKADRFNLLCISPPTLATDVDASVWVEAATLCRQQRAVLIVDPPWSGPGGWTTVARAIKGAAVLAAAIGDDAANVAVYFPGLMGPNPLRNNEIEPFASCGAVAAVIARTDANQGVWKTPAGSVAVIAGAPGTTISLTDKNTGDLSANGVNCLRQLPGSGPAVWGARTLAGADSNASQWKYLPVRRMALYLEESLYRGTQWAVFEPNDEELWAEIRLTTGAFLHDLYVKGAFQGSTPRDAYFVRCGRDTITQADLDGGIVNILVGFAPLRPAEFVIIEIRQASSQSSN